MAYAFLIRIHLKDVIVGFDAHFVGTTNETYERYVFNNRNQGATESVEDCVVALRTLSKACNFCDCMRDSLLRDRIVLGITDNATRKRLLQESALTFTSCIDLCRCAQVASSQLQYNTIQYNTIQHNTIQYKKKTIQQSRLL